MNLELRESDIMKLMGLNTDTWRQIDGDHGLYGYFLNEMLNEGWYDYGKEGDGEKLWDFSGERIGTPLASLRRVAVKCSNHLADNI